jgi:hypothetical protein
MVYVAAACPVVGVPVTAPVAVFKLNPAGKAGETEYVGVAVNALALTVVLESAVPAFTVRV